MNNERKQPLIVLFSSNSGRSDYETKPGELQTAAGFHPDIDPALTSHLSGDCSDAVVATAPAQVRFPEFDPPVVDFAIAADSLPGYTTSPEAYPRTTFSIPIKTDEKDQMAMILNGDAALVPQTRREELLKKLASYSRQACVSFSNEVVRKNLLTEPFNLLYVFRLADGSRFFPSAPILILPNEGAWGVEWGRGTLSDTSIALTAAILRHPCRLFCRLREPKDLTTAIGGGIIGIDIFVSPAASLSPSSEAGSFGHIPPYGLTTARITVAGAPSGIGETSIAPISSSSPGWIFTDTEREKRHSLLSDPQNWIHALFIPIGQFNNGAQCISMNLCASFTQSPTSGSTTWKPDHYPSIPARAELLFRTNLQRLTANPAFLMPAPTLPILLSAGASLETSQYGQLPEYMRITIGLRHRGRLHLLGRNATREEIPSWLSTLGDLTGIRRLFCPWDGVEFIAVGKPSDIQHTTGPAYLFFPMSPCSTGGSIWTRLGEEKPDWTVGALEHRFPDAISMEADSFSDPHPGLLLSSTETNPDDFPPQGRSEISTTPIQGAVDFAGRRSNLDLPLLLFSGEGMLIAGREEKKIFGQSVRLWRGGDYISTFRLAGKGAVCSTRFGVIFLTDGGLMLYNGSSIRRLSSRGVQFPPEGTLVSHPAADLIEYRLPDGEPFRWYDLETGKELTATEGDQSDGSGTDSEETSSVAGGDTVARFRFTTRPFRLEAPPQGIRLIGSRGIGNSAAPRTEGKMRLEGSADLREWRVAGERPGYHIESLVPFPGSPVWYRLIGSAGPEFGVPTGFIIDF